VDVFSLKSTVHETSERVVDKQELVDPAQEWQCENRASISSQLFVLGMIGRSFGF
jgi:hypothetical protein